MRALDLTELSRIGAELAFLGSTPDAVPDTDHAELPDLGSSFNDTSRWRHYTCRLEIAGLAP
jgi:hypothetical protein